MRARPENELEANTLPVNLTKVVAALSTQSDPHVILSEVASTFQNEVGYLLFTVSMVEPIHGQFTKRLWSSDTTAYPIGEIKPMEAGSWIEEIAARRPVVCNQPSDIKDMFPADFDALTRLGCGSGINLPVFLSNALIGSINLFHTVGWFTPHRVLQCQSLTALIYAPLLLCKETK